MIVWLFKVLGIQKLLGKLVFGAGLLALGIWLFFVSWNFVAFQNPSVKKLVVDVARISTSLDVTGDSLRTAQDGNLMLSGQVGELQLTIKEVLDSARTDRMERQREFDRLMGLQQVNVRNLNDLRKKDLAYQALLESGLRVDTLKLTYKKRLFGGDELVDSLYVFGF